MTVESGGVGRIKVVLNGKDSECLGISFKTIDCKKQQTRILLRAIFRAATEKLGQFLPDNRLLIEAYPLISGGGVLYFTPLAEEQMEKLRIKKPQKYAYDFSDGGNLLSAIELLYNDPLYKGSKSKIYDLSGTFRLVIETEIGVSAVLEFCENYCDYEKVKKYTCERGRSLTGDYAIMEIGSRL